MALATITRLPVRPPAMASRWRRRVACRLIGDGERHAILVSISGRVAIVATDGPAFGSHVILAHPVAGRITARVGARTPEGLRLHLSGDSDAAGFAMAAIAADMTRAA